MFKKFWPNLCSSLRYKSGQDFLGWQYIDVDLDQASKPNTDFDLKLLVNFSLDPESDQVQNVWVIQIWIQLDSTWNMSYVSGSHYATE